MVTKSIGQIAIRLTMPAIAVACFSILLGCQTSGSVGEAANTEYPQVLAVDADDVAVVDCLLPGQVRKLGSMTYLTPRRPLRTTALECEIRGGEYVAFDRSDLATSLAVWLPEAKSGSPEAQTYVGEIYQRGMGSVPDFKQAAKWFEKAAEQGYSRAQMSLGYLYEKGLGVPQDRLTALNWYRQATGLDDSLKVDTVSTVIEDSTELKRLKEEVERQKEQTQKLKQKLAYTQNNLENTRKALDQQSATIDQDQLRLEEMRKKLAAARNDADKKNSQETVQLETLLGRREAELAERQKEIERLEQTLSAQQNEVLTYQKTVARYQQQIENLPSPIVEIYDPIIVATRGVEIRKVPADPQSDKQRLTGRVWAPAGLRSLKVGETIQAAAEDGSFSVWVPLKERTHRTVEIVAVDNNGKEGRLSLELVTRSNQAMAAPRKREVEKLDLGKFYALIIGNNNYQHLPKLKTAVYDARSIADILKTRYGFETVLLLNAGRTEILLALDKFRKQLTEKDNFMIYYAGHGELDQKNSRVYWLPVDAATDSSIQWIRTDQITDTLNLMSPLRSLVIADTCYSGIMTRSAITRLESGASKKLRLNLIKILAKKRARVVLSSGGLKPVLDIGSQGHSVYASSLIKALSANNDILKAQELHDEVTKHVAFISEQLGLLQVPQYGGLIHSGHEMGDFIFVPRTLSAVIRHDSEPV